MAEPYAKRGEDDDGDNAPPSADKAITDLQKDLQPEQIQRIGHQLTKLCEVELA